MFLSMYALWKQMMLEWLHSIREDEDDWSFKECSLIATTEWFKLYLWVMIACPAWLSERICWKSFSQGVFFWISIFNFLEWCLVALNSLEARLIFNESAAGEGWDFCRVSEDLGMLNDFMSWLTFKCFFFNTSSVDTSRNWVSCQCELLFMLLWFVNVLLQSVQASESWLLTDWRVANLMHVL